MVEQGFSAHSMLLFERATKVVSPTTFDRNAKLAVLMLNFALLRQYDRRHLGCGDSKLLQMFEQALGRICASAGLQGRGVESAEAMFRRCLERLQDSAQDELDYEVEGSVILPLAGGTAASSSACPSVPGSAS